MDEDEKDLIGHLFAKASVLAEVAHDRAVQGQSARLEARNLTRFVPPSRDCASRGTQSSELELNPDLGITSPNL